MLESRSLLRLTFRSTGLGNFTAIGSNLAMQSRDLLSKKVMDSEIGVEGRVDKDGDVMELSKEEEETLASRGDTNLF